MSTTSVSRLIKAPRQAVYRACTELAAIAQWRVPENMTARVQSVDDAGYRMSLTYKDGGTDTFDATFVERVANEKVVELIRFAAADRSGEMTMTTRLRDADGATEVTVVCENLPNSIRPEDNEEGSRQALAKLARLLEG